MKIQLKPLANYKYEAIKNFVDSGGTKDSLASKLKLSIRQVNRLINVYKQKGKEGFIHGNSYKRESIKFRLVEMKIVKLYGTKYKDYNFRHFQVLLKENERISVSYSYIYKVLKTNGFTSPYKNTVSQLSFHPRLKRAAYFGEKVEVDACRFTWFNNVKSNLHAAIDQATGKILSLRFDEHESIKGYYSLLSALFTNYGRPGLLVFDRRLAYNFQRSSNKSLPNNEMLQLKFALRRLHANLKLTSRPEGKAHVERLFRTLKSRLTRELSSLNIKTLSEANKYVEGVFIKKFNLEFGISLPYDDNVFDCLPKDTDIDLTLSVIDKRIFDQASSIKIGGKNFQACDDKRNVVNFPYGTIALLVSTYSGKKFVLINGKSYTLLETKRRSLFKNFYGSTFYKNEEKLESLSKEFLEYLRGQKKK